MASVYEITNKINGKFYIGSAVSCGNRWRKTYNRYLSNAFKKYGKENFIFEVIEEVEDVSLLLEREQYWLDQLQPWKSEIGYNISPTASSSLGIKRSFETIEKLRQLRIGKKHSETTKQRISEKNKGKGRKGPFIERRGEGHPLAKTSWNDILQIRSLWNDKENNKLSQYDIGKMFNLSRSSIQGIINNKTWRVNNG